MVLVVSMTPVMYSDISGEFPLLTIGIVFAVGAISGVIGQIISDRIESQITGQPSEFTWHKYVGAALGGGLGMLIGYASGWNSTIAGAATGGLTSFFQDTLCNVAGDCNKSSSEIFGNFMLASIAGGASGAIMGGIGRVNGLNAGRNSMTAVFKSGVTKSFRHGFSMGAKTITKGVVSSLYEGLILDLYFGVSQSDIVNSNQLLRYD